jgi:hypothetical protein
VRPSGEGSAPLLLRGSQQTPAKMRNPTPTPHNPVILTESERGTSEAEWKDPEDASFTMPHQGVLP